MHYENMINGIFIRRPNRFLAHVEIEGKEEICHVKNTGRCKELLIPGTKVYVQRHNNPNRKTKFSLIGVQKENLLINMDSQAPNQAVLEWINRGGLFSNPSFIKREKTYGNSRFDLYVEYEGKKAFIEVKGVTLEEDGIAKFPDAPTERGIKHIEELIRCQNDGYEAYLLFVIQMKGIKYFSPNDHTHAEFGNTLRKASASGVHIIAMDCNITPDTMEIDQEIPVVLTP
ncbi:MAG: DNA/RNA nuclease SfsA [Lachnospiraceae bacterium]|nr:DNA/RNA nuclease SfsA [Lachnospiraceae bacterium]